MAAGLAWVDVVRRAAFLGKREGSGLEGKYPETKRVKATLYTKSSPPIPFQAPLPSWAYIHTYRMGHNSRSVATRKGISFGEFRPIWSVGPLARLRDGPRPECAAERVIFSSSDEGLQIEIVEEGRTERERGRDPDLFTFLQTDWRRLGPTVVWVIAD